MIAPLTVEQLCRSMPHLAPTKAAGYLPPLVDALAEWRIDTPVRIAAFLGQVAHESGEFRYWEELAIGSQYEGRKDLGNTSPGDGVRYKGRGPIQLTGRDNYSACGSDLALDLIAHPEQVATPVVGFRSSGWFWARHGLNQVADTDTQASYDIITRRINGGTNGKSFRDLYWRMARRALVLAELK